MSGRARRWAKNSLHRVMRHVNAPAYLHERTSAATKAAQRQLFNFWQSEIRQGRPLALEDTGFRNFSQFEDDGLLLYIFAAIGMGGRTFVDIGAADGINSNCANLALNFGWHGLFIDGDDTSIERGRRFYAAHPDSREFPPHFRQAFVQRENINALIAEEGFGGEVDLLSVDIDGNDYWIWDALEVIDPRVVVIETHVEFGLRPIVVPYDKDYCYPGRHPDYHGASPVAMEKLARRKGYRLVGSIAYGFNTYYVKQGLGEDALPAVPVEQVLAHPRNAERARRFEAIKDWEYLEV